MPSYREKPIDLVLDVRSRLEFFLGHLDHAVNIPVDQLPDALGVRPGVTPGTRILVYCASGGRSAAAASALRAAGYTRVEDGGGMAAARADYRAA
jgi:rhodanese-related sulfurtransferase